MESLELMPARVKITSIIKKAIYSGEYKSGQELSLTAVAEELGVSRTPVREAIRQLAKTSLVTLTPRKGAYVSLPSISDAGALYELREELEKFAAALVSANPPEKELKEFLEIFSQMDNSTDPQKYLEEDRRFHAFIYQASGNRFLMNSLQELVDVINLYRPYSLGDPDYIKRLAEGHVEIIEALLAHDEERVREAMGAHIRMSRVRLEAYLNTHTSERLQLRP